MTKMIDTRKFTVWLTDATSLADATETSAPSYYIDDSHSNGMEEHGWIKVGQFVQEFERPSLKAILPACIASIRKEITANNLKAATENAKLEAQISKLLAIEYDVGAL